MVLSRLDLEVALMVLDANGDGLIDMHEFIEWWESTEYSYAMVYFM